MTYPIDVTLVDQPPRNAPVPCHARPMKSRSSVLRRVEREMIDSSMRAATTQWRAAEYRTLSRSDRGSHPASSTSHRATSREPLAHATKRAVEPSCGATQNQTRAISITSHHITSHHITSHHITSHHITSHHITSHHITEQRCDDDQCTHGLHTLLRSDRASMPTSVTSHRATST